MLDHIWQVGIAVVLKRYDSFIHVTHVYIIILYWHARYIMMHGASFQIRAYFGCPFHAKMKDERFFLLWAPGDIHTKILESSRQIITLPLTLPTFSF